MARLDDSAFAVYPGDVAADLVGEVEDVGSISEAGGLRAIPDGEENYH